METSICRPKKPETVTANAAPVSAGTGNPILQKIRAQRLQ
jgi:hypothetical protein